MVDYTSMAALAERLINANGRDVTLIQQGQAPLDDTRPWRGLSDYPRARVAGKAVFTKSKIENPDNTKRKMQGMLFAANNDSGLTLEVFDMVEDGDVLWKVVDAEVISPAGLRVLYKFEVER